MPMYPGAKIKRSIAPTVEATGKASLKKKPDLTHPMGSKKKPAKRPPQHGLSRGKVKVGRHG